jgi:hypothetical protein
MKMMPMPTKQKNYCRRVDEGEQYFGDFNSRDRFTNNNNPKLKVRTTL